MKVLGDINPDTTEVDLIGGQIVALTKDEAVTLARLQDAADGLCGLFSRHQELRDKNMDNTFLAVLMYTRAMFLVNEFDALVEALKSLMTTGGHRSLTVEGEEE